MKKAGKITPAQAEKIAEEAKQWVLNATKTQGRVEEITRTAVGTPECPIKGLPLEPVSR